MWRIFAVTAAAVPLLVAAPVEAACAANWINGIWRTATSSQGAIEECTVNIRQQQNLSGTCRLKEPFMPWVQYRVQGTLRLSTANCAITGTTRTTFGTSNVRGAMDQGGTVVTGVIWDRTHGAAFTAVKINP